MFISGVALYCIVSCLVHSVLGNPYLNLFGQNSGEILGQRNSLTRIYSPFSQNPFSRQQDSREDINFRPTVRSPLPSLRSPLSSLRSPLSSLRSSLNRQSDSGEIRTRGRFLRPPYLRNAIRRSNLFDSGERGSSWANMFGSLRRRVNRFDSDERFGVNRARRNIFNRVRDDSEERFGVRRIRNARFGRLRDDSGERRNRMFPLRTRNFRRRSLFDSGERFGGRMLNARRLIRRRLNPFNSRENSDERFGGRRFNVRRLGRRRINPFNSRENSRERLRFGRFRTRGLRRINFRPFRDNSGERRGLFNRNQRSVVRRLRSPFLFQRRRFNDNSGERLSLFNSNWNSRLGW